MPAANVVIDVVDLRSLPDAEIEELNDFWNTLYAESHPEDPPTPLSETIASYRNTPDFLEQRTYRVRGSDGTIVAVGTVQWAKTDENKHMVGADISVVPGYRRKGVAKRLLAELVAVADAQQRTLIVTGTTERLPSGGEFARRLGAESALVQTTNRLLLVDVDREMVTRWIEEGPTRASEYSLITIDGAFPDDLVEALVDLQLVMNTAPRDDLEMEDYTLTVDEARQIEKSMFAAEGERWFVAARHDATGDLVGFSELMWWPSQPDRMSQGGTAVRPEHRGHALGKWLKATNIERILRERPEIVDIRTGNADSNDAMLGINTQLGFKPYYKYVTWQITVDKVKEYLDAS